MSGFYYQNYDVVFTPDYILSDLIEEFGLEDAELVQMFQEDKQLGYPNTDDTDMYYGYLLIFKVPIISSKVKIKDWEKLSQCSIRLQNILLLYYDGKLKHKIEYVEDINKTTFLRQKNAGLRSWDEFCSIIS